MTFKTPHATVHYENGFQSIQIEVTNPEKAPLDLMDIKAIYAAFFRNWLHARINEMKEDDVIKLGYYIGENFQ
jgi:hypothetical protein